MIKNKKGNVSVYLVVAGILIAAIVLMGIAFSTNIKGSLSRSFEKENAGFNYYSTHTAANSVNN